LVFRRCSSSFSISAPRLVMGTVVVFMFSNDQMKTTEATNGAGAADAVCDLCGMGIYGLV
jgi:hypothetical protein